ncbi:MAG: hypothetical protein ACOYL5_05035 [Phototrophicaceae bacterium]
MAILPKLVTFPNQNQSQLIHVPPYADAKTVAETLGFSIPQPSIFLSGGAGGMSEEDLETTRHIISEGLARFATEHGVVVIDGGTDTGVMRLNGNARHAYGDRFSLIGCAPDKLVRYPGSDNQLDESLTMLEDNHSHFALVNSDQWGAESDLLVGLTRAISGGVRPSVGILINGGQIAQYDVYIASARGEKALPVIVLEGSGRAADMIATATRSNRFSSAMLRAIVEGGRIDLLPVSEGVEGLYNRLKKYLVP